MKMNNANLLSVSELKYHSRLSFKIIEGGNLSELDLSKSLFNNCIFKNVTFDRCKLTHCDITGTQFQHCTFLCVNLDDSDFNSCVFQFCEFNQCSFDNSNISDCNSVKIVFNEIIFNSVTLNNNRWEKCVFNKFEPNSSSIFSNDFIKCTFDKSKLLNSIYYTIFDNCIFTETLIDSYIFGFQYGLKPKNLKYLTIEHFNEIHKNPIQCKNLLSQIYTERGMVFQNNFLNFIYSKNEGEILEDTYTAMMDCLKNKLPVKIDEIRFIRRLTYHFYCNKTIQNYYFAKIIDLIGNLSVFEIKSVSNLALYNEIAVLFSTLNLIKNDIDLQFNKLYNEISNNLNCLVDTNIEIAYRERPEKRLNELSIESLGYPIFKIIDERSGSFIEIFRFILANEELVNGIEFVAAIVTLLDIGQRVSKLISKLIKLDSKKRASYTEEPFKEFDAKNIEETTEYNIDPIDMNKDFIVYNISKEVMKCKTTQICIKNNKIIKKSYSKKNIKKIKINKKSDKGN